MAPESAIRARDVRVARRRSVMGAGLWFGALSGAILRNLSGTADRLWSFVSRFVRRSAFLFFANSQFLE